MPRQRRQARRKGGNVIGIGYATNATVNPHGES